MAYNLWKFQIDSIKIEARNHGSVAHKALGTYVFAMPDKASHHFGVTSVETDKI